MEKKITLIFGLSLISFFLFSQNEIRTYDGSNNNLFQADWGATHTQLRRMAKADYADKISEPNGANRPNPRKISNALFAQTDDSGIPLLINDRLNLSDYTWVFGQFLDHDLTLSTDNAEEPAFIPVNFVDTHFNPGGVFPNTTIHMNRNKAMEGTGTDVNNPRQHFNELTAWLDGSVVYGSDAYRANWLRSFQGGRLKTSAGNLLPYNTLSGEFEDEIDIDTPEMADDVGFATRLFVGGDIRTNENALLTCFHTIFVREHNRVVDELVIQHPNWTDEQLYQHARKIVGGFIQAITYEEWLPTMGVHIPAYTKYDEKINPSISNVFSAAAFRMGHTLLNGNINMVDIDGNPHADGPLALRNAFFNPAIVAKQGVGPFLKGMGIQIQQDMDAKVVDDVRNFLFGPPGAGGLDLAAININRGRERGLPDFNSIRDAFGLDTYDNFHDIIFDDEIVGILEEMYQDIDNIDPWVGMLAEAHMDNALFGETVMAIMHQQFTALRDGDRFYYENDPALSEEEKAMIKNTTFSDIIMRNTDIQLMQGNVFQATAHRSICGYYGEDAVLWGDVTTASSTRVAGISVNLTTESNAPIMSSLIDGAFSLEGVPTCEDITVTLSKEDSFQTGVSTLDMIMVLKHIVGLETFHSPYQYIIADVNKSNSVTTADIVAIRKVILGISDSFPNNTAWRFVDANYNFLNPANPLAENFPESTTVNLSQDASQDFVALKIGDLNDSASRVSGLTNSTSRSKKTLVFETKDMELIAGNTYTIPFQAKGDANIAGYQFTLKYIHSLLEFININSLQLASQDVSTSQNGVITATQYGPQYTQAKDLSFELTFSAKQTALLSDVLSIQVNPTPSEAYNEQLEVMDLDIQFTTNPIKLQVSQNQPNPFSEMTIIGFDLPVAGFVEIAITDLAGKQLLTTKQDYPAGANTIQINRADLDATGVLYYQLTTEFGRVSKKMIVVDGI